MFSLSHRIPRTLVLALLLAPGVAYGQTVRGVVVEDSADVPIAGVRVDLVAADVGEGAVAETDAAGTFLLRAPQAGRFILRVAHLGYGALESHTLVLRPADALVVEVRLTPEAIPIKPIVVVSRGSSRLDGFYERVRRRGSGQFLTRAELERRPGARATDLLRGMRGVEIREVRAGPTAAGTTQLISLRGGVAGCHPTIYIDGMPVRQFAASGVDDFVTPDALEGVEVYTSSASAPGELSARSGCGVVAFWTRPFEGGQKWSWGRVLAGLGAAAALAAIAALAN